MPEDNATLPESVSREAHQRMTDERNEARSERDQLKATVLDLGYTDKARKHFAAKGVDDPEWAADIALPTMRSANVEADNIGAYLDETFARLYPGEPDPDAPVDDGVPTPDATDAPGFARPSPGSDGQPPVKKVYSTSDPEIKAIIASNDRATFQKMVDSGELELRGDSPVNPG